MPKKPLAQDERVIRFADVARRFCRLIESRASIKKRDFVRQCAEILPELQMHYMRLLTIKTRFLPHAPRAERERITHEEWQTLFRSLGRKLTKDDAYHHVFNPYSVKDDDPTCPSLSDDLADIYRDVKEGLDLLLQGDRESTHDAVYHWKESFLIHTGHHCVSALRPLQVLIEGYNGIVQS